MYLFFPTLRYTTTTTTDVVIGAVVSFLFLFKSTSSYDWYLNAYYFEQYPTKEKDDDVEANNPTQTSLT